MACNANGGVFLLAGYETNGTLRVEAKIFSHEPDGVEPYTGGRGGRIGVVRERAWPPVRRLVAAGDTGVGLHDRLSAPSALSRQYFGEITPRVVELG